MSAKPMTVPATQSAQPLATGCTEWVANDKTVVHGKHMLRCSIIISLSQSTDGSTE